LWRGDNLVGSYAEDMIQLNAGSVWLIKRKAGTARAPGGDRLDAKAGQAYRIADNGEPVLSPEQIPDVGLRNLGFQIRYRYELAPLSYLYIAYVRGGSFYEEDVLGGYRARDEFQDAFASARQRTVAGEAVVPASSCEPVSRVSNWRELTPTPAARGSRTGLRAAPAAPGRAGGHRG
jgi:hypothetical protein